MSQRSAEMTRRAKAGDPEAIKYVLSRRRTQEAYRQRERAKAMQALQEAWGPRSQEFPPGADVSDGWIRGSQVPQENLHRRPHNPDPLMKLTKLELVKQVRELHALLKESNIIRESIM